MSKYTKHNKQIKFSFSDGGKAPIIEMQVESLNDLILLENNYSGKLVWVIDIEKLYFLSKNFDGSELSHWKIFKPNFSIELFDNNKNYGSGEIVIYDGHLYYSKTNNNQDKIPNTNTDFWNLIGNDEKLPAVKIFGVPRGFGRFDVGTTIPEHESTDKRFIDAFQQEVNLFTKPMIVVDNLYMWNQFSDKSNYLNPLGKNFLFKDSEVEKQHDLINNFNYKLLQLYNEIFDKNVEHVIVNDYISFDTDNILIWNDIITHPNKDKTKQYLDGRNKIINELDFFNYILVDVLKLEINDTPFTINIDDLLNSFTYIPGHGGNIIRQELLINDVVYNGTYSISKNDAIDRYRYDPIDNDFLKIKLRTYYEAGTEKVIDPLGNEIDNNITTGFVDSKEIKIGFVVPIISMITKLTDQSNPLTKQYTNFRDISFKKLNEFGNFNTIQVLSLDEVYENNKIILPSKPMSDNLIKIENGKKYFESPWDYDIKLYVANPNTSDSDENLLWFWMPEIEYFKAVLKNKLEYSENNINTYNWYERLFLGHGQIDGEFWYSNLDAQYLNSQEDDLYNPNNNKHHKLNVTFNLLPPQPSTRPPGGDGVGGDGNSILPFPIIRDGNNS